MSVSLFSGCKKRNNSKYKLCRTEASRQVFSKGAIQKSTYLIVRLGVFKSILSLVTRPKGINPELYTHIHQSAPNYQVSQAQGPRAERGGWGGVVKEDCDLTRSGAGDDGGKEPICNTEGCARGTVCVCVPACVFACVCWGKSLEQRQHALEWLRLSGWPHKPKPVAVSQGECWIMPSLKDRPSCQG